MDIREKAKELGIKSYWNKKEDRLLKEIEEKENPQGFSVDTSEDKKGYLKRAGIDLGRLACMAQELTADRIEYRAHKKAFECFKKNKTIEFISISSFQ